MYISFFKRIGDIVLSLIAMVILLPLFIPIAILLLLTGEHKVFFLQDRIGYKGRTFKIWKFTSMVENSDNLGTGSITVRNDPRVLPVGRFLRKTKLNELPQIINVLLGDMSFVGARPQPKVDFDNYTKEVQTHIYNTRPGITGVVSIIFRDEERLISEVQENHYEFYKNHIAPYKGELEMWYQQKISFNVDLMLLFITFWVVLCPHSELVYKVFKDLPPKPAEFK